MSSNVLRVVPALSQHHTGNAGNIDSHMADMGQLCPSATWHHGVKRS